MLVEITQTFQALTQAVVVVDGEALALTVVVPHLGLAELVMTQAASSARHSFSLVAVAVGEESLVELLALAVLPLAALAQMTPLLAEVAQQTLALVEAGGHTHSQVVLALRESSTFVVESQDLL